MGRISDIARLSVLALMLLSGCAPEYEREYRGSLYFGSGAYLGEMDLRDGSVSLLANLGNDAIREIDAFGDGQLLLSVYGPVNHENTYRLMQYEIATHGLVTLIDGRYGRYLPEPQALVFDDGARLRVRLYGGGRMDESVVIGHRLGARVRILQIGDTRFLYSVDPDKTIFLFDVETGESRSLTDLSMSCALDGALWIAEREALLCKRAGDPPDYAFVGLDGVFQSKLAIVDVAPFRAVAYLADQDALVLSETWKTLVADNTRYAVWIYDLANHEKIRLVKDQVLGSHVVYRSGT